MTDAQTSRRPSHAARGPGRRLCICRCAYAVAEDSGPSAAQLPLAGVPEKQGHLMLELEITYRSPGKKEQQPRYHLGVLSSTKNGTVPAESATVVTVPAHAVRVSWPETLCSVGVPSVGAQT